MFPPPSAPISQLLAMAAQHHQAGRLAEAEAFYRQVIAIDPNHADALHRLGTIACQVGRYDVAVKLIQRSIALRPHHPSAHSNLGLALAELGRREEAAEAYRRALELRPDYPEAHLNLGLALAANEQWDDAVEAIRRALEYRPDYPEAHYNLGTLLLRQGKLEEAANAFHRTVEINPGDAQAYYNLGLARGRQGRLHEAIAAYQRAIECKPDYPEAHNNLGSAWREAGSLDKAISAYRRVIEMRPDWPVPYINLGVVLGEKGNLAETVPIYRQAIALDPRSSIAHLCLGRALREQGNLDDAAQHLEEALALQPDSMDALNSLGNLRRDSAEFDEAVAAYRRAVEIEPTNPVVLSNLIYALHLHPSQNEAILAEEQRRWNQQFSASGKAPSYGNKTDPNRRLRVGYVSPDLHSHPIAFFLAPLLEEHDRSQFEIYCYACTPWSDEVTECLRKAMDVWRDCSRLTDAQLAELVQADGIDILVDLAMHTAGNRLLAFARRPAPIQVSWLAYPGSTGVEAIDYRLTDAWLDSADQSENPLGGVPVRLPDCWCCYEPVKEFPAISPSPVGQSGVVTFGSFNQFAKMNEELWRNWARLLREVPRSRLLMVCPEGRTMDRVRTLFTVEGIGAERLELIAPCRWPVYTQLFGKVDLALDTFPCNGMTTTCHALWMGVPVITRVGKNPISRPGASLLHTLGLSELIASSEDEYVAIAKRLASDLSRLVELRDSLRSRMKSSPLMDAPRFARQAESAYRTMWQKWCAERGS